MSWLRLIEERMKETEKQPAGASPSPRKKNRFAHLLGEMWPAYLIEIVVIILGISITLALEEWRDNGKEEKLEKVYLANLSADIDADRRSLRYALAGTAELLAKGNEMMEFVTDPAGHPLTARQVNTDVRSILARPKFLPHDATFSDLKQSANLHLLKDVNLKWILFAYYSQAQNIKYNQEAEQQATIMLSGNYFLHNFALDTTAGAATVKDSVAISMLPKNIEFRNHVLARVGTRMELQELYRKADSLALQVQAALPKKDS